METTHRQVLNRGADYLFDLNAGMGDPWAGHVSVFGTASRVISRDKSDVPENLGAEPPTGSTEERQLTCVEMLIWDGHTMTSKRNKFQICFFTTQNDPENPESRHPPQLSPICWCW